MKSLIILRGLVKRDKKDWVRSQGLNSFLIDLDLLRNLFYRPELMGNHTVLVRSQDDSIHRNFLDVICSQLSTGCLVIVDAEQESTGIIEDFATIFGYTVFNKYFSAPHDYEINYRKYSVVKYKYPKSSSIHNLVLSHKRWKGKNLIKEFSDIEDYWKRQKNKNKVNLKSRDNILHFSDIHSNYSLYKEVINSSYKINLTIFLGDYIDGPEIGGSRRMMDEILNTEKDKTTISLSGNHELRLRKWLGYKWMCYRGKKTASSILETYLSNDFLDRTSHEFDDLYNNDYELMLKKMNTVLRDYFIYNKDNTDYVCSHVGFTSLDQINPKFIGNLIYSNQNPDKVDSEFSRINKDRKVVSVHGHCKYPSGFDFLKYNNVINIDTESDEMINYFISKNNICTKRRK